MVSEERRQAVGDLVTARSLLLLANGVRQLSLLLALAMVSMLASSVKDLHLSGMSELVFASAAIGPGL